MRYGPNLLEEILRRTDLVQLVGRRVKLVRKGRVMWGCCPFHQEKSPSFKVENERRTYKCFGCGAGGDAFRWVMETEGLTFPEAVEKLASEAGVELPKWSPEDEAREEKKKSLYEIVELACQFFEEQLRGAAGNEARKYLATRGISDAVARQFRLGFAPGGNGLIAFLKSRNISLDDMIAAGLARASDDAHGTRDFFFNRLTFPISDPRGRIIAFGARALEADAKPKYINTGETALFAKGRLLYNFASARAAALRAQTMVLAEGYMDVIALVRAGIEHAVAPLGTALTEDQLALLWRVAPEPILAFDGDEAGLRAASRAARLALPQLQPGHSLRFVFLPMGEDPDSFIAAQGSDAMKKLLGQAEPLAAVLWRLETEGRDFSTPERRAGLERVLAGLVAEIREPRVADYYRRDFEQRVFEAFRKRARTWPEARSEGRRANPPFKQGGKPSGFRPQGESVSPAVKNSLLARAGREGARPLKELELGLLLFENPEIALIHGEVLAQLPFRDRVLDRLRHELLNLAASGSRLEKTGLENHLVRVGLADLVTRLKALARRSDVPAGESASEGAGGSADGEDAETRWLKAAAQLREIAELDPERMRAMERFKSEATEESWREAHRLLGPAVQND